MVPMLNVFFMTVTHSVCTGRQCSCPWPVPPRHTAVLHVWALELYTLCCAASHSPNCTRTTRSTHSSRHPLRELDTNLYKYGCKFPETLWEKFQCKSCNTICRKVFYSSGCQNVLLSCWLEAKRHSSYATLCRVSFPPPDALNVHFLLRLI